MQRFHEFAVEEIINYIINGSSKQRWFITASFSPSFSFETAFFQKRNNRQKWLWCIFHHFFFELFQTAPNQKRWSLTLDQVGSRPKRGRRLRPDPGGAGAGAGGAAGGAPPGGDPQPAGRGGAHAGSKQVAGAKKLRSCLELFCFFVDVGAS